MDSKEEKGKKLYMEFQVVQRQLEKMQSYLQEVDEKIEEYTITKNALSNLNDASEAKSVYVPVASGIFAKAKIENVDKLLVNVGADTVVLKDAGKVSQMVKVQLENVKQAKLRLEENMELAARHMNSIVEKVQKL